MILVGDSLGMVVEGFQDTIPVTMDMCIQHCQAVRRGAPNTFVVGDMPFGSYQVSDEEAARNAIRFLKEGGVDAIKLEGGKTVAPAIKAITDAGIPVVGHVGMTPQSANAFGGFKVQGKGEENARRVLEDALAVQEAGAFAVTLECVPPKLAALITKNLDIITIGIGAGSGCDAQVLVCQDLLGMFGSFVPKFVKQFAQIGDQITEAFRAYDKEVKEGVFPTEAQSFAKSDSSDEFLAQLDSEY
jgi:3-methyl-2-oxobutanoate hydroxymethyltransferase